MNDKDTKILQEAYSKIYKPVEISLSGFEHWLENYPYVWLLNNDQKIKTRPNKIKEGDLVEIPSEVNIDLMDKSYQKNRIWRIRIEPKFNWKDYAHPLNNKRLMGTVDTIDNTGKEFSKKDLPGVIQFLQNKGYQTKVIPSLYSGRCVIYYKILTPKIQTAIDLFTTYENTTEDKDPSLQQGLTKEQHVFLGKIFGYSNADIKEFIEGI